MNEFLILAAALIAGMMLGVFFFGGLWWTVRKGMESERVALWFVGSMLLRTSVVLLGFYFVLGDDWRRLVAGLLGFVVARIIVTRLTRSAEQANPFTQDARHAP
ncbi:MAG: ATP synthase subunit I [Sulfuriferula multivorans]|uniref:ATP synthase subunit I n=1 Tax=Sulfuriferula multivorans TaxID=1559896 RepID=A0A7C9P5E6_9PROT|nr:ATP synthase subunit I [Sulfuriferula multivorans]